MDWLSSKQAADFLGIDVESVRRLVRGKHLPCYSLPGVRGYRFKRKDLELYVEAGRVDSAESSISTTDMERILVVKNHQIPHGNHD